MWEIALQLWGGIFYLLNKIFFCCAERSVTDEAVRRWKLWAWGIYIAGMIPWLVILSRDHDWIFAFLELGGLPSMVLGFKRAWFREIGKQPKSVFGVAVISCIVAGGALSLWHFRGLNQVSQLLEILGVGGFLIGTYLLSINRSTGYFWYVLMHVATAGLMWRRNHSWLALQQMVSLPFVVDAWYCSRAKEA